MVHALAAAALVLVSDMAATVLLALPVQLALLVEGAGTWQ